jgi:hypothetical protein
MSAAGALVLAVLLAGCGTTTYFAGRTLPPSGLTNRVLIAIQNPSAFTKGALQIVDAYYDVRFSYNDKTGSFSISGYSGALPTTIQNMPEEQLGAVYGSGDGSFTLINYAKENTAGAQQGLNGLSSSVFVTRNVSYVFAASQTSHVLTILDHTNGGTYALSLPGIYRVSVNAGGSTAMAFVQNSDYAYYPLKLSASQTLAYSGGPTTWPLGAVDCEPLNAPNWCLFQALDPSTHKALKFNRPVKAVFSADGSTAYVLNCGYECGGTGPSSVSLLPVAPMIYLVGQGSGSLPTQASITTIPVPGGASNALIDSSTMYVIGQCPAASSLSAGGSPQCSNTTPSASSLFTGNLTVVNLTTNSAGAPVSISDGAPGALTRIIEADDNTLWIGMTKCTNGERYAEGLSYGCLTMYNTSTQSVTMIEPYLGDLTGIASVTGLHKVYVAQGGQVYIYKTTDGSSLDNQYVTVTGTAYDVAYMDGLTDGNNTVY